MTAAADARATRRGGRERGQVVVAFALLLPVVLALGAIVIDARQLVHARAAPPDQGRRGRLRGRRAWGFPCAGDIDLRIEELAREYVGPHVQADGTAFATTTYNPQVGGVPGSNVHVVLNGSQWYDNDSNPFPLEQDSPLSTSICESKTLDVKATEDDSFPLFGVLPFFPDIKRKARVEIQEIAGLTGLLPIAVRLPQPLSAAVAFYDESTGTILDVKPLREVCSQATPACLFGVPPGLGQWTSEPAPGGYHDGLGEVPGGDNGRGRRHELPAPLRRRHATGGGPRASTRRAGSGSRSTRSAARRAARSSATTRTGRARRRRSAPGSTSSAATRPARSARRPPSRRTRT